MYRHILIPIDGSELASKAVEPGITLARQYGAKLTFVTAMPRYRLPDEGDARLGSALTVDEHHRRTREKAQRILAGPARQAHAAGIDYDTLYLENDRAYQGIIDAAELKGCDLIVMSSHRRGALAALLYGSETRAVLTHSRIPTLVTGSI
jgi:nucleotide-binding universal stress UspA family protein